MESGYRPDLFNDFAKLAFFHGFAKITVVALKTNFTSNIEYSFQRNGKGKLRRGATGEVSHETCQCTGKLRLARGTLLIALCLTSKWYKIPRGYLHAGSNPAPGTYFLFREKRKAGKREFLSLSLCSWNYLFDFRRW
jgi:hypothetical protein